jgi:hypothetical protein
MSGDHNMNQTDSGWRKRQIALDKMSENARELGLDYDIHSCSHLCTRPMCVAEAVQAEREACAKVCEPQEQHDDPLTAWKIAEAIRARGKHDKLLRVLQAPCFHHIDQM